jgi:beta-lactamase family protein
VRRAVAALCAATLIALAVAAVAAAAAKHHRQPPRGPFVTAAMRAFLASRAGDVTAGVYNVKTGRLFLYRPSVHGDDASIAKVDIVATAIYEAEQRGGSLTATEQELATEAIEESDNDAAQDLWEDDGGNAGIAAFNARVGMTQTILDPQGAWGLYESTARDQLRLLEHVALPNPVLTTPQRSFELALMHRIDPAQDWGVSAGVLPPATVALKNGWLPVGAGWEINSIGAVTGRYRDYLIAVLTSDDPSMAYGVETIEGISQLVWSYMLPARFRPKPTSPTG